MDGMWRARPLDAAPRVLQPRPGARKRARTDPLAQFEGALDQTREQIDALERLLGTSVPPKVVIANSFYALRHAIFDEFESVMQAQWLKGRRQTLLEDAALAIDTGAPAPLPDDLAQFLDEVPGEEIARDVAQHGLIDLEALEREINSVKEIVK